MGLDLQFDDLQQAVADAVAQFCRDRCDDDVVKASAGSFPSELWKGLSELGVLALSTPEGDGGALELVAALESLGAAAFPGPLPATFFATQLLPEKERCAVASGAAVVSAGTLPLMPFAPVADVFIVLYGNRVFLGERRGEVETVETLGGEPWGFVRLDRGAELGADGGLQRALALYDIAFAAYTAAAGNRILRDTCEHARTRKQFGRALGEFQAVAHPLADCAISLDAAATLARMAAFQFQAGAAKAAATAAAARLSARRAALDSAHTCHQLFGAVGITLEGPVFHISRRLRQLASQPPGDTASRASLLEQLDL